MTREQQRQVEAVAARLRGEYRRDDERATDYLGRIADRATNRSSAVHIVAGIRVVNDYETELPAFQRHVNEYHGYVVTYFKGIRVRLDVDLDPNFAQLKEN